MGFLNRFRDFCLFSFLLLEMSFLGFLGVLAKSSMTIFCSWLPNAIERPTPVSSLLHSSTIVVARVFMLSFLGLYSSLVSINILIYGTFIGLIRGFFQRFQTHHRLFHKFSAKINRPVFYSQTFFMLTLLCICARFFQSQTVHFFFCGLTI